MIIDRINLFHLSGYSWRSYLWYIPNPQYYSVLAVIDRVEPPVPQTTLPPFVRSCDKLELETGLSKNIEKRFCPLYTLKENSIEDYVRAISPDSNPSKPTGAANLIYEMSKEEFGRKFMASSDPKILELRAILDWMINAATQDYSLNAMAVTLPA